MPDLRGNFKNFFGPGDFRPAQRGVNRGDVPRGQDVFASWPTGASKLVLSNCRPACRAGCDCGIAADFAALTTGYASTNVRPVRICAHRGTDCRAIGLIARWKKTSAGRPVLTAPSASGYALRPGRCGRPSRKYGPPHVFKKKKKMMVQLFNGQRWPHMDISAVASTTAPPIAHRAIPLNSVIQGPPASARPGLRSRRPWVTDRTKEHPPRSRARHRHRQRAFAAAAPRVRPHRALRSIASATRKDRSGQQRRNLSHAP